MAIEADYKKLKERAKLLANKIARAEGELDAKINQLREEYDVESIEEAKDLLEELKKEQAEAEEDYTKAVAVFEDKWGDLLGES